MLPMLCLPSLGIMLRAFFRDDLVLWEIGPGSNSYGKFASGLWIAWFTRVIFGSFAILQFASQVCRLKSANLRSLHAN